MADNPENRNRKIRVMLDANVLIAGTAYPRFPYEVMIHALNEDYYFFLTPPVIEEARRNVHRKIKNKIYPHFARFLSKRSHGLDK